MAGTPWLFPAVEISAVSGQSVRRSNETLLTERSDGWGETQRWRSRSRGDLGQASLPACGSVRWPEVWRGGGWILRDGRAHKRSRVPAGAEWSSEVLSRASINLNDRTADGQ